MAAVLFVIGIALTVAGVAVSYWPAALIVAGVIALAVAVDLGRPGRL